MVPSLGGLTFLTFGDEAIDILSLNMQGSCAENKMTKVQRLIQDFSPIIDLFSGQEHHYGPSG